MKRNVNCKPNLSKNMINRLDFWYTYNEVGEDKNGKNYKFNWKRNFR
mgnify:CR=1 FL=1